MCGLDADSIKLLPINAGKYSNRVEVPPPCNSSPECGDYLSHVVLRPYSPVSSYFMPGIS